MGMKSHNLPTGYSENSVNIRFALVCIVLTHKLEKPKPILFIIIIIKLFTVGEANIFLANITAN